MNVLKAYFDESIDQRSPVQVDYNRIVKYDEKGNEIITFEEVDYKKIVDSNGKALNWSLNNLLAAGINPDFSISTGYSTRLDGIDDAHVFASKVDSILNESNVNN